MLPGGQSRSCHWPLPLDPCCHHCHHCCLTIGVKFQSLMSGCCLAHPPPPYPIRTTREETPHSKEETWCLVSKRDTFINWNASVCYWEHWFYWLSSTGEVVVVVGGGEVCDLDQAAITYWSLAVWPPGWKAREQWTTWAKAPIRYHVASRSNEFQHKPGELRGGVHNYSKLPEATQSELQKPQ